MALVWEEGSEGLAAAVEKKLAMPDDYRVVLYNDDYTTKDFVVAILTAIFHKDLNEAVEIMESIHKKGRGIAGIYTYDIAATRVAMVVQNARSEGFPLRCEMEKI